MDQVYRIGRRLGKLMLALLMVVSLFDLTSLFANDETNAPAKVIQLCDEENIQSSEDGELLIPWSSTIETTDENMLLYNDYENTMQENLYATPDTLNLQIVDHTGGKQIELVEGTDYELYYTNPSDGLFTMNKEDAAQFTHFKIMFTDKTKTFSNMIIKYNTHAKIADVKENEQERKFLNEATFKIETNYWITETATYTYTNPNFKPVENSMNAQENVNAIYAPKEFNWEDDIVKIKASVTQRDIPENVIMKAERVNETADKENNIITEVLDQVTGIKFYYQVTFTSNDEVVAIDQSKIKFESSVKTKVKVKPQYRSARSTTKTVNEFEGITKIPEGYEMWKKDFDATQGYKNDAHKNKYSYGDFGENKNYDLFYILANYNVFTSDYYKGTHVVGPVAIGGNYSLNGLGGLSHKKEGVNECEHTVPSYLKGAPVGNSGLKDVITRTNVPVFFGIELDDSGNDINLNYNNKTLTGNNNELYYNYYFTEKNDYINFDNAMSNISNQIKTFSDINADIRDVNGNLLETINVEKSVFEKIQNRGDVSISEDKTYYFEYSSSSGKGLRIKLGYNYVFDKDIIKNLDYIVYDYESLEEASTLTTLINIPDEGNFNRKTNGNGFPEILKSQSDKLDSEGSGIGVNAEPENDIKVAYQFGSLETEKAFNIVFMVPNATDINVQRHLAGHLVAPNAHLDLCCGDYNGSIIAKSAEGNAEGHMWPFKLDTAIVFDKTVNGQIPEKDEKFTFTLENINFPEGATKSGNQIASNNITGRVIFPINDLKIKGDYIYKITENDPGSGYAKDIKPVYAKVNVDVSNSTIAGGKLVPKFVGFYSDEGCTTKIDDFVFNNKREFGVTKKWYDDSGKQITQTDSMPEVNVTLMQKYKEDVGYTVAYNLYAQSRDASPIVKLIDTQNTSLIKRNGSYEIEVKSSVQGNGVTSVKIIEGQAELSEVSNTIKLTNISTDCVVAIYVTDYGTNLDNAASLDLLKNDNVNKSNIANEAISGEREYEKFSLNNENNWYHGFDNLPSSGDLEKYDSRLADKTFKFSYYVKEESVDGFTTEYENNNGTNTGTIVIKNKKKPVDVIIQKISSTYNTLNLAGAEFELYKLNGEKSEKLNLEKNTNSDNSEYDVYKNGSSTNEIMKTSKEKALKVLDLTTGDYVLKETKAPDDFKIVYENIFIHIDFNREESYIAYGFNKEPADDSDKLLFNKMKEDHGIQVGLINTDTDKIGLKFIVKNTPVIVVPEAGGTPDDRYQKIGFLIACLGFAMFAIYETKRRKNIKKEKI